MNTTDLELFLRVLGENSKFEIIDGINKTLEDYPESKYAGHFFAEMSTVIIVQNLNDGYDDFFSTWVFDNTGKLKTVGHWE